MPEHAPAPDSTVRLDVGRPTGTPPITGSTRQVTPPMPPAPPAREADDTRPVPRDWLRGRVTAQPLPLPRSRSRRPPRPS